jgi:hypothetical protein
MTDDFSQPCRTAISDEEHCVTGSTNFRRSAAQSHHSTVPLLFRSQELATDRTNDYSHHSEYRRCNAARTNSQRTNTYYCLFCAARLAYLNGVQSFEILLVVDNEAIAQTLSATLRRAGHRVTASTTIAGTVETLMRRGPYVDVIMTSTRFDSSLGYDAVQYGRRFAANARFIVLREVPCHAEDVELALARQSVPDRLHNRTTAGWN